ncbi:hypothetical protein ACOME3_003094 [Neoechinorhynchus agilis]
MKSNEYPSSFDQVNRWERMRRRSHCQTSTPLSVIECSLSAKRRLGPCEPLPRSPYTTPTTRPSPLTGHDIYRRSTTKFIGLEPIFSDYQPQKQSSGAKQPDITEKLPLSYLMINEHKKANETAPAITSKESSSMGATSPIPSTDTKISARKVELDDETNAPAPPVKRPRSSRSMPKFEPMMTRSRKAIAESIRKTERRPTKWNGVRRSTRKVATAAQTASKCA